jgi:subtilisin family serine protease
MRWRATRPVAAVVLLGLIVALPSGAADLSGGPRAALASEPTPIQSLELAGATGGARKPTVDRLESALDAPAAGSRSAAQDGTSGVLADRPLVMVTAHSERDLPAVRREIEGLGGQVTAEFGRWLDARVPADALARLATLPEVDFVQRPPVAHQFERSAQAGSRLTEGATAADAAGWHAAGVRGQGVTVAILDSFQGYANSIASGDLPPQIALYPDAAHVDTSSSPHGTAVAEVIHDMAPDASLVFATPQTPVQRASYILDLARAGVRVISSSTGTVADTPGDGTGPVAGAIAQAASQYGLVYVQAAGNQAQCHWDGLFADADGDGLHEFAPGVELNMLNGGAVLPAGFPVQVFLRWDAWPASSVDYDLLLLGWDGSQWVLVAASTNTQNGTQPPYEGISYVTPAQTYYALAIGHYSGAGSVVLDLNAYNVGSFAYRVPERSLVDDATASAAVVVAAVDAAAPYPLEPYSSRGPTRGLGGAMNGGAAKPDLAAYANVSTVAYGPRTGAHSFNGTSAATPHVSGAAALLASAFPGYTRTQIVNLLRESAIDLGPLGYDYSYGVGRLHLPAPAGLAPPATPTRTPTPVPTATPAPVEPLPGAVRRVFVPVGLSSTVLAE